MPVVEMDIDEAARRGFSLLREYYPQYRDCSDDEIVESLSKAGLQQLIDRIPFKKYQRVLKSVKG